MNKNGNYILLQNHLNTDSAVKVAFLPLSSVKTLGYTICKENYSIAYRGRIPEKLTPDRIMVFLESLFHLFNVEHPQNYSGRSMSISDIVILQSPDGTLEAYYCDSFGFKKLDDFPAEQFSEDA